MFIFLHNVDVNGVVACVEFRKGQAEGKIGGELAIGQAVRKQFFLQATKLPNLWFQANSGNVYFDVALERLNVKGACVRFG